MKNIQNEFWARRQIYYENAAKRAEKPDAPKTA